MIGIKVRVCHYFATAIIVVSFLMGHSAAHSQDITIGVTGRGAIAVSDNLSGVAIYLDGQPTGKLTPATLTNISQGPHTVAVARSGYAASPSQMNLQVNAGQTTIAQFTLTPSASATTTLLSAPTLTRPINAYAQVQTPVQFSWSPVQNALRYRFRLSDKPDVSSLVLDRETTGIFLQYPPDGPTLSKGFTYYWKVYAVDATGTLGNPSEIFNFQLDPGAGLPSTRRDVGVLFIDVYPPSPQPGSQAYVTVKVQNLGGAIENNVSLIVTDGGAKVWETTFPVMTSGEEKWPSFPWTPTLAGNHVLRAKITLQTTDDYTQNDAKDVTINVTEGSPGSPMMSFTSGDFDISPDKQEISVAPGQYPSPTVQFLLRRDESLYPPLKLRIKDQPPKLLTYLELNGYPRMDEVEILSNTDQVKASFYTWELEAGKYYCTFLATGGGKEKEFKVSVDVKAGGTSQPGTGWSSEMPTVSPGGATYTSSTTPYRPFIPSSPPPLPSLPETPGAGRPSGESPSQKPPIATVPRPPSHTYGVRVSAPPDGKAYSLTTGSFSRLTFSVEESKGEGVVFFQRETSFLNQHGTPIGETLSEVLENPVQLSPLSLKSWEEILYLPPAVLIEAANQGASGLIAVRSLRGATSQTGQDVSAEACLQIAIPGSPFSASVPSTWGNAELLLKAPLFFERKGETPVLREMTLRAKRVGGVRFQIPHVPSGKYRIVVEKDRETLYEQAHEIRDGDPVDLNLEKGGKE